MGKRTECKAWIQNGSKFYSGMSSICRFRGKKTSFVRGNEIVRKEGITHHLKSSLHVRLIATMSAADKKSRSEPTLMEQSLMKMDEATMTKMNILLRTVGKK